MAVDVNCQLLKKRQCLFGSCVSPQAYIKLPRDSLDGSLSVKRRPITPADDPTLAILLRIGLYAPNVVVDRIH